MIITFILLLQAVIGTLVIFGLVMDLHEHHYPWKKLHEWRHLHLRH